jgi:ABC-type Zn uptake system ZnuABC Zn-binding protein ZnuA
MEYENKFHKLYNNIAIINKNNIMVSNVAKILSREEKKHVDYYKNLIKNYKKDTNISDEIYKITKSMFNEFKKC